MTLLILFLGVVFIAGVVLGTFDRYVFKTPKWFPPSFLNAHISLGLLTAVYTLRTFSEDQPIFWRESSHGLNRLSFMLGRIIVNTVDWFMMCYMFTGIYFLISEPEINYFAWVIPDLLVAWVASGWGYLIAGVYFDCRCQGGRLPLKTHGLECKGTLGDITFRTIHSRCRRTDEPKPLKIRRTITTRCSRRGMATSMLIAQRVTSIPHKSVHTRARLAGASRRVRLA
ncbi:unnamed protein product [Prorocentrum cordatum]|uniref:ABC transporter family G domain-containing protein n=1 Tax=Prorocentrum cordatum TaxID=2364126 RepID=A0ABN9T836_9DINO|nr:unnamed protein product [Polarella glacialis]